MNKVNSRAELFKEIMSLFDTGGTNCDSIAQVTALIHHTLQEQHFAHRVSLVILRFKIHNL